MTFTKVNTAKKIDKLDAKDKIKLNYKQLRKRRTRKKNQKKMIKQITDEETDINDDLFNKFFKFQRPSDMIMLLNKTNDTEKNNKLVNLINSGLKVKKMSEIKKMSEAEIENEDPQNR